MPRPGALLDCSSACPYTCHLPPNPADVSSWAFSTPFSCVPAATTWVLAQAAFVYMAWAPFQSTYSLILLLSSCLLHSQRSTQRQGQLSLGLFTVTFPEKSCVAHLPILAPPYLRLRFPHPLHSNAGLWSHTTNCLPNPPMYLVLSCFQDFPHLAPSSWQTYLNLHLSNP